MNSIFIAENFSTTEEIPLGIAYVYFISESTALEWLGKTGLVKFSFPPKTSIDTETDKLSLGLITPRSQAVILRADSLSSNDYLELEIVSILSPSLSPLNHLLCQLQSQIIN